MYVVGKISTRNDFGNLLNDMGLIGKAVEVGTHRGDYAKVFMDQWKGEMLYCVDPWGIPAGYERQAGLLWGGENRDDDLKATGRILMDHTPRTELVRKVSNEAVRDFADGSLDFVYIDGNHEEPCVSEDLEIWWPKVKSGGLLAGHDIICPEEEPHNWGKNIQPAVERFSLKVGAVINIVSDNVGGPFSYYLVKP